MSSILITFNLKTIDDTKSIFVSHIKKMNMF